MPAVIDSCLYFLSRSSELIRVNGSYVDDLLRAGNDRFKSIVNRKLERFETSRNDDVSITFAGIHIEYSPDLIYTIDQLSYVDKLTQLREDATFKEFSSMRMRLAGISNTRLDLLYEISQLAQVTQIRYDEQPKKLV